MLKKTATLVLFLVISFGIMLASTRSSTFLARDSLLIGQDPERVWQVLADVERWSQWWPGVEEARLGSSWAVGEPLELVFKGNPTDGPARIECCRVGRELAFSREGVLWSRASTGLRLEPKPGALLVTVESMVRGPQAFLARFTGREAFAAYHQRLLAGLDERTRISEFPGAKKESFDGR